MSGQRVRCADSSAVWLTTRSQRREAHLKAEVVTKVLNVFSSQTFTQRETVFFHPGRCRGDDFCGSWWRPWEKITRATSGSISAAQNKWSLRFYSWSKELKCLFLLFFALSHARFHLPNKLPKRSFHTFSSYILPVPVGWCYHVVIKR